MAVVVDGNTLAVVVLGTMEMVVVAAMVARAVVVAGARDMRGLPAVTAIPMAIARLMHLGTRSKRFMPITQPIAATVELAHGRNISARSKAVGMVVPASRRGVSPPVAELVSSNARVADGQAGVANTFD